MNRAAILATPEAHAGLVLAWSRAAHRLVGYYLIIPNHVHLFCAPGIHTPPQVTTWAKCWKRLAGEELQSLKTQWQKDCWNTQMRSQEHYLRKLEYVAENPVRQCLVERPEDGPYAGRLNELRW